MRTLINQWIERVKEKIYYKTIYLGNEPIYKIEKKTAYNNYYTVNKEIIHIPNIRVEWIDQSFLKSYTKEMGHVQSEKNQIRLISNRDVIDSYLTPVEVHFKKGKKIIEVFSLGFLLKGNTDFEYFMRDFLIYLYYDSEGIIDYDRSKVDVYTNSSLILNDDMDKFFKDSIMPKNLLYFSKGYLQDKGLKNQEVYLSYNQLRSFFMHYGLVIENPFDIPESQRHLITFLLYPELYLSLLDSIDVKLSYPLSITQEQLSLIEILLQE